MKILVTGGAGYIGAHFLNRLKNHEVIVVDNFCQTTKNVLPQYNYVPMDIRDYENLLNVFKSFRPEIVVHYAAVANVPDSVANPNKYYDNNIIGSLNVLDGMREVGCKKIIFSSTAAVYGETGAKQFSEESEAKPGNPYGYTKLVFEHILKDYHKAYGINSISFRYFCACGCDESGKVGCYHEPETQAIPNLCKTLLGQQKVFNVWGNDFSTPDGTGVRDYIHVNDLADAHILALTMFKKPICEVYNLGINKGFSVMDLIREGEKVTGKKLNYEIKGRRAGDPGYLIASSEKFQKLGWKPKYTDIGEIILTDYNFFKTL